MSETQNNGSQASEPGHEIINDVTIRFAGDGGEGVITSGDFMAAAASSMGLEILKVTSLPAEIKGGPAMIQVRIGRELPQSQGSLLDVLVCFNDEVYHLHKGDLKPNGILLYDSECKIDETNAEALKIEVPFTQLAKKQAGGALAKNMVVMGSVGAVLGISFEQFEKLVHDKFDRKGEKVVEANLNGLRIGHEYVQQWVQHVPFHLEPEAPHHKLLMSGNDAIALGAVASGLSVFAGYPITPASTIMEKLATLLPSFGGKLIQAEDEIAALGMVLGASFAGHKSATATSGPGVSLMAEEIGLASMTELPCVIFDAQRGGPSTGMPTKEEQSDLNLAIYGGHGDAPRLVLAPANVEDCFHLTVEAFNLSEMCQMPTLLLTDFYLAQAGSTINEPDVDAIEVIDRLRPNEEQLQEYNRFALTENNISPMAKPGEDPVYFVATGLEHNEKGNPDISPAAHRKMSDKRHGKLRVAQEYAERKGTFTRRYGSDDAKIGIITWGSTEGAISEAIDLAAKWDLPVQQLHLLLLNPLPEKEIYDFIYSKDKVIVAELNYTGQLAQRLRAALSVPVDSYTKCTGQPFTPYEIFKEIMVWHGWDAERSDPVLTQVARVQHQYQVPIPAPGHQGQDEHMAGSVPVTRF